MTINYVEFDQGYQDFLDNQDNHVLGGAPFRAIFRPAKLTLKHKNGKTKSVLNCRMATASEAERLGGDTIIDVFAGGQYIRMATSRYDEHFHTSTMTGNKIPKKVSRRATNLANKMIAFVSQHWLSDLHMDDDETAAWKAIENS